MKGFDEWFRSPIKIINGDDSKWRQDLLSRGVPDSLIDYNLTGTPIHKLVYPCRCCGDDSEVPEPEGFKEDYHYCGKSERCIP